MKNKVSSFAIILLLSFIIGSFSCCLNPNQSVNENPNIILILADDLGWSDLGYTGSTFYETPNIDALAASGMIFTDAYAASPVCSPTRSSIMTGKAPARTRNTDWFGAPQPGDPFPSWMGHSERTLEPAAYKPHMDLEEYTLAEVLKDQGYKTFIAGKWHLGHEEKYWPENQGFDINKGGYLKGHPPINEEANGYFSPYGNPRLTNGPEGEYLPYRLASETKQFIRENKDTSFFVYHPFYLVHTPIQAQEEMIAKYERKKDSLMLKDTFTDFGDKKLRTNQSNPIYASMVEAMDKVVGDIYEEVKSLGIEDKTIIIFTADNGGLSTNSAPTCNFPLKAGKGWLYEGGIREPMFVIWPGQTAANSVSHEPVISTDIYQTIVDMIGIDDGNPITDGQSIVPILSGRKDFERKALYWHYPHFSPQGGKPGSAIRNGDWKLIKDYSTEKVELYNLKTDIGETIDLSEKNITISNNLLKELEGWLQEVGGELPQKKSDNE